MDKNHILPRLHVGGGSTTGGLTVFPVWMESQSIAHLEWNPASVAVSERPSSPVVDELVAQNHSGRFGVVLEGDILQGGWQNRMAIASRVLHPGEQISPHVGRESWPLPVWMRPSRRPCAHEVRPPVTSRRTSNGCPSKTEATPDPPDT